MHGFLVSSCVCELDGDPRGRLELSSRSFGRDGEPEPRRPPAFRSPPPADVEDRVERRGDLLPAQGLRRHPAGPATKRDGRYRSGGRRDRPAVPLLLATRPPGERGRPRPWLPRRRTGKKRLSQSVEGERCIGSKRQSFRRTASALSVPEGLLMPPSACFPRGRARCAGRVRPCDRRRGPQPQDRRQRERAQRAEDLHGPRSLQEQGDPGRVSSARTHARTHDGRGETRSVPCSRTPLSHPKKPLVPAAPSSGAASTCTTPGRDDRPCLQRRRRSREKVMAAIDWLPKRNGCVAVSAVKNASFDERVRLSGQVRPPASSIVGCPPFPPPPPPSHTHR